MCIRDRDPIGIQELREIIESFKSDGMTVMISSHILSEVEHLADFIGFIYEGKIVLEKDCLLYTSRCV